MTYPTPRELRFYCFINFYLSSIQQGIQTGHASVDLLTKYNAPSALPQPALRAMANDWAKNFKTYISLNGGNNKGIKNAFAVLSESNRWPWAPFFEDEDSLGGLMTCVGVVLPEYIFEAAYDRDLSKDYGQTVYSYTIVEENSVLVYAPGHPDYALISLLKACRLAS